MVAWETKTTKRPSPEILGVSEAPVGLDRAGGHAEAGGEAGLAVVAEDVGEAVGIAGDEVAGLGLEDDEAAVVGDVQGVVGLLPRAATQAIALSAVGGDADAGGLAVRRSWTNTSRRPLVSPGTRLLASDQKATKRPSAEIRGAPLSSLPGLFPESTLTRLVTPAATSRTRTSPTPGRPPGTRLVAPDAKAIRFPSAEMDERPQNPSD